MGCDEWSCGVPGPAGTKEGGARRRPVDHAGGRTSAVNAKLPDTSNSRSYLSCAPGGWFVNTFCPPGCPAFARSGWLDFDGVTRRVGSVDYATRYHLNPPACRINKPQVCMPSSCSHSAAAWRLPIYRGIYFSPSVPTTPGRS